MEKKEDKSKEIEGFDEEKEEFFEGKNGDKLAFFYGMSPGTIEAKRGHAVAVKYKKTGDLVSGYLWNIDPWSGTRGENETAAMCVIMSDSVFSITCSGSNEPITVEMMDAYVSLSEMV
ncbi:unnamed protein product [Pneumocystis jirovecii]|uniref:Uncharacterized protein n=1 Tax=Pneumocystis jirovecii TaxID=42068 RepID=L0PCY3_PNEJI|nr:unnamed protein product [Pneumocystis jirovecii]